MRARRALAHESPHTAPSTLKRQEHTTDTAARSALDNTSTAETHSLTYSLTSRTEWRGAERSAVCDTIRVHAAVRSKKVAHASVRS